MGSRVLVRCIDWLCTLEDILNIKWLVGLVPVGRTFLAFIWGDLGKINKN